MKYLIDNSDLRNRLIKSGSNNIKRFDMSIVAKQLLDAIQTGEDNV